MNMVAYKQLMVIVPHRGVNAGKSRLSPMLNDVARGRLNRWLLERTLRVVSTWLSDAQHCVVVSPCEVTLALARKAGAIALRENPAEHPPAHPTTSGLNTALSQAAAHAASLGTQRLLILPCDLPRLEAEALETMATLPVSGTEVVIAPDRHDKGTNALLVDAGTREFAFGQDSYARRIAQGEARGVRSLPYRNAMLAFDLDTVEDFTEWINGGEVPSDFLATLALTASRSVEIISSRNK